MHLSSLLPAVFFATPILGALQYKGVDWSSLLIEEKAGRTYKTKDGKVQPFETILKDNGVNMVRQRIWVNPSGGNYSLDYNIKLAQRAKAAGLQVYLDFHYSDNWADPGKQVTPSAWKSLNRDALVKQIYDYTKSVMDEFQKNSIPLHIVSIGNEITPGLLFPIGQLSNKSDGPKNVAALLKSASQAIKESSISPKPKIMIHLDNGWKWDTQKWWYDTVLGSGGGLSASDYDIQGVSYYPFYNSGATLSALGSSLQNMVSRYGKEIQVVETNWPTSCSSPSNSFPSDTKNIPFSPEGQSQWIKAVAAKVAAVGAKGTGLFYWEPAWIDNAGLGSSCAWNLQVDKEGRDMGSLGAYKEI